MLRFPRNFVCQWAQPTLNKVLQGVRRSFIHDTAHSQKDRSLGNVLILEERSLLSGTPFPIESQVDFEVVSFTDPEITTTPKPDQSTLAVLEDPFQQELVSHKPIQEKPGQNSSFSSYTTSKIKTPSPTNLHQTGRQEVVVIDPATQNHKQLVNDLLQNLDPNLNLMSSFWMQTKTSLTK